MKATTGGMMYPVKAIPHGYPRVTAYLYVNGAEAPIEFYAAVFGATERMRLQTPDGKIGHSEVQIGDGLIMLSDEFLDWGVTAPPDRGWIPGHDRCLR